MAFSSYPFNNQDTTETQYSDLFRELQDTGVAASADSTALAVSADGSGMKVFIQPGFAIVRGYAFNSTAVENLPIAVADTATRIDRVVLRLDPASDTIVLAVVKGTPGGAAPALTQTTSGIWETPLGLVTIAASAPTVVSTAIKDDRRFVGHRVGIWSVDTRPATPRKGRIGFNTTNSRFEFWNGTAWSDLSPTIDWAAVSNKPTTFPPSDHTHTWATITSKPTSFPPSAHTHSDLAKASIGGYGYVNAGSEDYYGLRWDGRALFRVNNSEFVISLAGHPHDDMFNLILAKADNYGNAYTVKRADGSDGPHTRAGSGYSVWVDANHNFVRNTSSLRYKENVRDLDFTDPRGVLALRPVRYDRKPTTDELGNVTPGNRNEVGLIAEEVAEHLPEIVSYHPDENGVDQIDSVRYDLLGLALVPVVQEQDRRIADLERMVEGLRARRMAPPVPSALEQDRRIADLERTVKALLAKRS